MSSILGGFISDGLEEARRHIGKYVQEAARVTGVDVYLDALPHIAPLMKTQNISIKLADTGLVQRALDAYTFGRNTNFIPIPFSVRDEKNSKDILFNVELRPTEGFVVFNLEQKHPRQVLSVVPEATHLGTVYHPTGATIYKIIEARIGQIVVRKGELTVLTIDRETNWMYHMAHMVGACFDDSVEVKKSLKCLVTSLLKICTKGGIRLGIISPKLKSTSSATMNIEFMAVATDLQRATMLSVGLLMLLRHGYPALARVVQDAVTKEEAARRAA